MSNIAALGDSSSILMFKAIGASVFEAKSDAEALDGLRQITTQEHDLVFITDDLQPALQPMLDSNPNLVYLFIPPIRNRAAAANKYLEDIIQKTVGVKH